MNSLLLSDWRIRVNNGKSECDDEVYLQSLSRLVGSS